jgi:protein tyrosine phosphatase
MTRKITQFQYTAWPDHGLPVSTTAFLDLAHEADDANATKGPIVVHCRLILFVFYLISVVLE